MKRPCQNNENMLFLSYDTAGKASAAGHQKGENP
jgi:hypothetical protein